MNGFSRGRGRAGSVLGALFVSLGIVALAACGSSSANSGTGATSPSNSQGSNSPSKSSSRTTNPDGTGATKPSSSEALCKQFSTDDVAKLFGEAATAKTGAPSPLAKEQCVYQNTNRSLNHPYWLFQTRHYTQPAVFDASHVAYKNYTNLSGIGDAAFIAPDLLGTGYTVQVKKGDDVYTFDINVSSSGTEPTVPKDAFLDLIRSKLA